MQQILFNILSNAIKYSQDEGKIELSIDIQEINFQTHLFILVRDEGIGISPRKQQHIFDIFGMLDDNITKNQTGFIFI